MNTLPSSFFTSGYRFLCAPLHCVSFPLSLALLPVLQVQTADKGSGGRLAKVAATGSLEGPLLSADTLYPTASGEGWGLWRGQQSVFWKDWPTRTLLLFASPPAGPVTTGLALTPWLPGGVLCTHGKANAHTGLRGMPSHRPPAGGRTGARESGTEHKQTHSLGRLDGRRPPARGGAGQASWGQIRVLSRIPDCEDAVEMARALGPLHRGRQCG